MLDAFLAGHIGVGILALGGFWSAALLRKGSAAHRQAGRVYILAMVAIIATVLAIAAIALEEGNPAETVRLLYVSLITFAALWIAWRSVRNRHDPGRFAGAVFRTLALLLPGCGFAFVGLGFALANFMTIGFGLIGVLFGGAMLRFLQVGPQGTRWWLGWHLNGICLLFAATHDSFLSLGTRSLLPDLQGPTLRYLIFYSVLGSAVAARLWLQRKYLGNGLGARRPSRRTVPG